MIKFFRRKSSKKKNDMHQNKLPPVLEQNSDGPWKDYLSQSQPGYSKPGYAQPGYAKPGYFTSNDEHAASHPLMPRQPPQQRWRGELGQTRAQMHGSPHSSQPLLLNQSEPHLLSGSQELAGQGPPGPLHGSQPQLGHQYGGQYGGGQYGGQYSVGHDESFPLPPGHVMAQRGQHNMTGSYESVPSQCGSHHSNQQLQYRARWAGHPGTDQYADSNWYHNEDQMRYESDYHPNTSNRNSAASTDSGQGGSATNFLSYTALNQHRLSGQSSESGLSSRQSYHSNSSSSSLGSLDLLEESGYSSQLNVAELVHSGLSDNDIIHAWLVDLHVEEYFNNFMAAGYDMGTISRMTPEDLNAIGITKPGHRKRLKAEIAKLHIHDGIPDYKPAKLSDWLRMLNLDQYAETLHDQGYDNLDQVLDITWEDLEDIGIKKLGHQKKMILAIDRLKRIQSGKGRNSVSHDQRAGHELADNPRAVQVMQYPAYMQRPADPPQPQYPLGKDVTIATIQPRRSSSSEVAAPEMRTFQPEGSLDRLRRARNSAGSDNGSYGRRSSSREDMCTQSRERDDETPTNDGLGRGDEPRDVRNTESPSRRPAAIVSPLVSHKPKPIAKIMGNQSKMVNDEEANLKDDLCKVITNDQKVSERKKEPPPVPKRTNSAKEDPDEECVQIPPCVKSLSDRFDKINTEPRDMKRPSIPQTYREAQPESVNVSMPETRKSLITPPAIARIAMAGGGCKPGPPVAQKPVPPVSPKPMTAPPPVSPKPPPPVKPPTLPTQQESDDEGTLGRTPVRRKESGGSIDSTHSGDMLPFANENVGTIKQRSNSVSKPSIMNRGDLRQPSSGMRRPSLPATMKDVELSGDPGRSAGSTGAIRAPSFANYPDTMEDALKQNRSGGADPGDVLNDIDTMLQGLTDELDSMLVNNCENKFPT